jgi:hypothetical protein
MPAINFIRFVELARLMGTAVLLGRAMTPSLMIGVGAGLPSSAQSSQVDLSHQEIGSPPPITFRGSDEAGFASIQRGLDRLGRNAFRIGVDG